MAQGVGIVELRGRPESARTDRRQARRPRENGSIRRSLSPTPQPAPRGPCGQAGPDGVLVATANGAAGEHPRGFRGDARNRVTVDRQAESGPDESVPDERVRRAPMAWSDNRLDNLCSRRPLLQFQSIPGNSCQRETPPPIRAVGGRSPGAPGRPADGSNVSHSLSDRDHLDGGPGEGRSCALQAMNTFASALTRAASRSEWLRRGSRRLPLIVAHARSSRTRRRSPIRSRAGGLVLVGATGRYATLDRPPISATAGRARCRPHHLADSIPVRTGGGRSCRIRKAQLLIGRG